MGNWRRKDCDDHTSDDKQPNPCTTRMTGGEVGRCQHRFPWFCNSSLDGDIRLVTRGRVKEPYTYHAYGSCLQVVATGFFLSNLLISLCKSRDVEQT